MFLKLPPMFLIILNILLTYSAVTSGLTLGVTGKQSINVLEGDTNVTLNCPVIGARFPVIYKWSFNGQLISMLTAPSISQFIIQGDFLMIKTVSSVMQGEFSASITDSTTATVNCSFNLHMFSGPTFTGVTNRVAVRAGANVTIQCVAKGHPAPVIYWIKDGIQLGYTNNVQTLGGLLHFQSISVYDIGSYQCNATNGYGSVVSEVIQVSIEVPLAIAEVPQNPFGLIQQSNQRMVCNFTGYPPPVITWYKDNNLLQSGNRFAIVSGKSKQNAWAVLTFKGVRLTDAGEYRCMAVQGQAPISYTFRAIVAIPPTIVSVHVRERSVKVGLPVTLSCKASGSPQPVYTWYHNQQVIFIGSHYRRGANAGDLVIPRTLPTDSGSYECTASNSAGMAKSAPTLLVVEGVKFSVQPPKRITLFVGQSEDILCQVQGNTNVFRIGWYTVGHRIQQCQDKVSKPCSVYADHGTLHLRNVQLKHRGNYTCKVTELGLPMLLRTTTFINVVEPVVFIKTPPKIIEEDSHGTVTLECQVQGNPPPKIIWLKNGIEMKQSGRHEIMGGRLTLTHLHMSDSAIYSCFAFTKDSQGTRESRVRVRTPPGILNITITPGHMEADVFWQVDDNGGYDVTSVSLEYRQVDEGGWRIMKDLSSANQHTYKLTHLKPISKYEINIWASNKLGNGVINTQHFETLRDQQDASGHFKSGGKGFIILGTVLCVFLCLVVVTFFYIYQKKGKSCSMTGIAALREDTRILVKHQHSLSEPHQHANPAFDPNTVASESVELNEVQKNHTKVHSNLKENKKTKSSLRKDQNGKKKLEVVGIDNMVVETELDGAAESKRNVHFEETAINENNCNNTNKQNTDDGSSDDDPSFTDEYSTSSDDITDEYSLHCQPMSSEGVQDDSGSDTSFQCS